MDKCMLIGNCLHQNSLVSSNNYPYCFIMLEMALISFLKLSEPWLVFSHISMDKEYVVSKTRFSMVFMEFKLTVCVEKCQSTFQSFVRLHGSLAIPSSSTLGFIRKMSKLISSPVPPKPLMSFPAYLLFCFNSSICVLILRCVLFDKG